MNLHDRVAIVTGAGTGIGKSAARTGYHLKVISIATGAHAHGNSLRACRCGGARQLISLLLRPVKEDCRACPGKGSGLDLCHAHRRRTRPL